MGGWSAGPGQVRPDRWQRAVSAGDGSRAQPLSRWPVEEKFTKGSMWGLRDKTRKMGRHPEVSAAAGLGSAWEVQPEAGKLRQKRMRSDTLHRGTRS